MTRSTYPVGPHANHDLWNMQKRTSVTHQPADASIRSLRWTRTDWNASHCRHSVVTTNASCHQQGGDGVFSAATGRQQVKGQTWQRASICKTAAVFAAVFFKSHLKACQCSAERLQKLWNQPEQHSFNNQHRKKTNSNRNLTSSLQPQWHKTPEESVEDEDTRPTADHRDPTVALHQGWPKTAGTLVTQWPQDVLQATCWW